MTVWIDADSCPTLVRNHVAKHTHRLNIPLFFVANKDIPVNEEGNYKRIIVSEQKDAADNYILEHAEPGDLVITRDIIFAEKLITKNICTINDRGTIFTNDNIREMISERNYNLELANLGLVKHFNEGYDKKKFGLFANCFDKCIHQLIKKY